MRPPRETPAERRLRLAAAAVAAADVLADRLAELAEHTPPESALAAEITAVLAALR